MKKTIIISVLSSVLLFVSCNKNELVQDSTQKVDIASYVADLNQDYNQASLFHSALMSTTATDTSTTTGTTTTTGNDGTGHSSHHIVGLKKVNSVAISFNKLMFAKYDSLFSVHYFKYCIDMLKNDIMMVDSMGMMVNKTSMTAGTIMNGGNMGSMMDKNKMLSYMDSLHLSFKNTTNPNYLKIDSTMHDHMLMSKTMTNQTDSIDGIYSKMLFLRRNHKLNH